MCLYISKKSLTKGGGLVELDAKMVLRLSKKQWQHATNMGKMYENGRSGFIRSLIDEHAKKVKKSKKGK